MKKYLLILCCTLFTPLGYGAGADVAVIRQTLLDYLTRLSDPSFNGTIIGQSCGSVKSMMEPGNPDNTYANNFEKLAAKTGNKYPGIVDVSFEYLGPYSDAQIKRASDKMIEHWGKGGLVAITWTPRNPFDARPAPNTTGDYGTCEPYHANKVQGGCKQPSETIQEDLNQILMSNPVASSARSKWKAKLDQMISRLKYLQDAGVVVMFRPLQEHNGNNYWYAKKSASVKSGNDQGRILEYDPQPYVALWRDMHNYFKANGVRNLIWIWSPVDTEYYSRFYYPGDAYVDVVGGTAFRGLTASDPGLLDLGSVRTSAYADWVSYGKPVGFAEYDFSEYGELAKQPDSFDVTNFAKKIKAKYPKAAYFTVWDSWKTSSTTRNYMSLIDQSGSSTHAANAYKLINDPYIITADEIYAGATASSNPPLQSGTLGRNEIGNLILNPGFQSSNKPNSLGIAEWSQWTKLLNNFSIVGDNAYAEGQAVKLDSDTVIYQSIPINPGREYKFSAWGKVIGSQWGGLAYAFADAHGNVIGDVRFVEPGFESSYAKRAATAIKAPAGAANLLVGAWNKAGGTLYVDDFDLR